MKSSFLTSFINAIYICISTHEGKMHSLKFVLLCACIIGETPGNEFMTHQRKRRSEIFADVFGETYPIPQRPPMPASYFNAQSEEHKPNDYYDNFNEYEPLEMESVNSQSDELTLDDILSTSKGEEIIFKEAKRRMLLKIGDVIDQVSEEILEELEGDAGAAMVAEKEDSSRAQTFNDNMISSGFYVVLFSWAHWIMVLVAITITEERTDIPKGALFLCCTQHNNKRCDSA
ncbi:unnamed protein product [Allacma fusca]|uniref:Uncharacterized protein n=1 Tax=Allacma fusca TaxID=39272 RepID=A0A8J2M9Y8_9HEXA|nr:unnamed protein product [Allacma fusca]